MNKEGIKKSLNRIYLTGNFFGGDTTPVPLSRENFFKVHKVYPI